MMLTRRTMLWTVMFALPLLGMGGWFTSHLLANSESAQAKAEPFICPLTGEELPCPTCCPLNGQTAKTKTVAQLDCCDDPTCPPGCSPECPPDCLDATSKVKSADKASAKTCCPPCPFCP